ncbi:50S ribosomal protein L23 [Gloeobacter kilaueensis]|uniref:Large ribosomal subunit protein uL23 n=1 Tax=Gloeobacter kilaueensis (strain ATCC BAA-2537 / CCAP 1431/1 / ULC 316 / JS1) TaxID=1183438 RepID=U5QFE9_GLOK1|nr:50S ribosomal protein L23 [Gloeobacter kilaueensis]AGY56309.1 50S ribosomal protein L23 [Gloeobacter kilaueensis JS1]
MSNGTKRALADIVRRPLITEKGTRLLEANKYLFEVSPGSNKIQIAQAIEELFSVKVIKVNTFNPPARRRRVGQFVGKRPHYKRAIVTLQEGDSITLFPEV